MERFNALGRGTQIMLVSSVLLLIISFFNWQEVEFDLGPLGEGSAGVSAWDDLGGILMGILTIVLIARIVAQLAAVDVPLPVSYAMTTGVLAFLIFAIALIKNLTDDYSTWASYVGVVLAFLVAVGAWLEIQSAGGVDSLRSEASSFGSSGGAATTEPAAAPAPPAAPAAETAPAAPVTEATPAAQEAYGAGESAAADAAEAGGEAAPEASGGGETPQRDA
jgi:hypothetical protein